MRSVLLAVFRQRYPDSPAEDDLRGLMKRIQRLEERRNALVHSAWLYSELPESMTREKMRVSSSGLFKVQLERFESVEDLERFVGEIDVASQELSRTWITRHLGVRPASAEGNPR